MKSRTIFVVVIVIFSMLSSACSSVFNALLESADPLYTLVPTHTSTLSHTPFPALTNTPVVIPPTYTETPTFTPLPTDTPTDTITPLPTDTPIPSDTPVPSPMVEVSYRPGDVVVAPIILYHHVSNDFPGNRYYVTLADFRAQLQALRDWGYTVITPTELANVLLYGGNLPERPIIITFDDGNLDIYQNAFPIMREFGYPGALYIIGTYFQGGSRYYMSTDQIKEMADAGWEIGSHSMTHKDLTTDYSSLNYEIRQSKLILEEAIGQPVNTFSFPYGKTDGFITTKVSEYGYLAAVSLGLNYKQSLGSIFFLTRIEVRGDFDLAKFGSLLPWHGN